MNADDRALEERLAAEPMDPDDLALLNSLRAYYDEHDPVPDGLVERICTRRRRGPARSARRARRES